MHEGTGKYAKNGNGRKTPWFYTDRKTREKILTHGSKPRPFLRDSMDKNRDRIAQFFQEAVSGLK